MPITDYIFETLLGKGSFGHVYLVRRSRDGKPFVLKEQILDDINDLNFKIVLNEMRCLETLRHPNIVSYYGAWTENKHSYILLEYATRCTLKDLLERRQTSLNETDALYLFSQMLLGVHHIHHKNIMHRDLKPENILLTGSRGDCVKIGDFGVSGHYQKLKNESETCAGTYYYMAPEMLIGQFYDYKCDIWSMGVILYEMVMRKLPFTALDPHRTATKITGNERGHVTVRLSQPTINLISKMLQKLPINRPRTDQLMLCPSLVPFIVKIHLNLGRTSQESEQSGVNKYSKFFKKY